MAKKVNYDLLSDFGKRVEMKREEKGISRKALVEKMGGDDGLQEKTYRSWIHKNGTQISIDRLQQLCDILKCDADYLMGRIDEQTHDNEWICKKTGLSEETIMNLKKDPSMVYTINYIQTCSCASDLFKDIRSYIEAFPIPLKDEDAVEVYIEYQDDKTEGGPFGIKDVFYGGERVTHETIRTTILYRIRDNLETIRKKKEYSLRMMVK